MSSRRLHPLIREMMNENPEAFGAMKKVMPARTTNRSSSSRPQSSFSDPRLRGLDLGSSAGGGGYDMAARRYAVSHQDPYSDIAKREQEIGRRMPLPYQAASALAGMPSARGHSISDEQIYADLSSSSAILPAPSVSGQRQTQSGSFGARTDTAGGPWLSARQRLGDGRDPAYSTEWDNGTNRERKSGRVTQTGTFSQEVSPESPWLRLTSRGTSTQAEGSYDGMALVKVTAGLHEGGGEEQSRTFWLGGGMVASFDLNGWSQATVEVIEMLDGAHVGYAWTTEGLPGDNSSLYFPQRYTTAPGVIAVPEGAYAVTIENPIPGVAGTTLTLSWVGRLGGSAFTFTQLVSDNSNVAGVRPYVYFGEPIPTLAPSFRLDTSVDLVWWLRTI